MKKAIIISLYAILAALTWNSQVFISEAGYKDDVIKNIYDQIAIDHKNTATVDYTDTDYPKLLDIGNYVATQPDNPDDLFDGPMIYTRGYTETRLANGRFTMDMVGGYSVQEADELTDKMVKEISNNLRYNASPREKMAAICDYISTTYDYDQETATSEDNGDYGVRNNFVDGYYNGNNKILCTDFAALTYLLANKMGVKCELMFGNNHIYNRVTFDGKEWIGYDLAKDSRYGQITLTDYYANSIYHTNGNSETEAFARTQNSNKTYTIATPVEMFISTVYFGIYSHYPIELTIIALFVLLTIAVVAAIITKVCSLGHKSRKRKIARA